MTLRENRFVLGVLFPLLYEIGLIGAYLFFMTDKFELFLLLPTILLIFPAYIFYIYSPYLIVRISRAAERYSESLRQNINQIFLLKRIDLDTKTKNELQKNIQNELLPKLRTLFRRGYIDSYFTRDDTISDEKMLTFRETLFLFSICYGLINVVNVVTIIYLHFKSINLDFLYIDQIINPINVVFFGTLFSTLVILSLILFLHSRKNLATLICKTSYNLSLPALDQDLKVKTRQVELDSIRRFPLADKIGTKLAANWDLVSKIYFDFIETHINDELRDYTRREVARTLVLEQYSSMLNNLDLSKEKRRELEMQFFLGHSVTDAIEELGSSEEEAESLKLDVFYATKKLEKWEELSTDEHISTFLFLWRSTETLFRHVLWKRNAYPTDDQSWPSIVNALLREQLLMTRENKDLKRIRLRRNAMLHRSQDRFVSKEDVEDLLNLLQAVIDRS
ncbi:MAG: hypothetical protein JSW11_03680 [Candidatus Heimdallarchaeota archaeon]|nr:MAG: hypothetical protein JSW11_03680 [Candidatus Heimdallarchaeota archaeon]